jgi:hypothetical protein
MAAAISPGLAALDPPSPAHWNNTSSNPHPLRLHESRRLMLSLNTQWHA